MSNEIYCFRHIILSLSNLVDNLAEPTKHLAKHFNDPFSCLGGNTEKFITFSICKFKKISNNKKSIAYQMKFIALGIRANRHLILLIILLNQPKNYLLIL